MLDKLRRFFDDQFASAGSAASTGVSAQAADRAHKLAGAALLVEMTRADFEVRESERSKVVGVVTRYFELSAQEAAELTTLAEQAVDQATSLYEFTELVNRHFDAAGKERLIRLLWDVALADGRLDRYEDNLVRKVADLIHVPHSAFIRAKLEAMAEH